MYKPQYVDKYGQPASESRSLLEHIIGYKPRYVTPPEYGVKPADAKQKGGRRDQRSPDK